MFVIGSASQIAIVAILPRFLNPFYLVVSLVSPRFLFRRIIFHKTAFQCFSHSINLLAVVVTIGLIGNKSLSLSNTEYQYDVKLRNNFAFSAGSIFVYLVYKFAHSYFGISTYLIS
jgi:hypothetical protein